MIFDKELYSELLAKASESDRKRFALDLRTSAEDGSQRMLNAMMPGTKVPIHRHPTTSETAILLYGRMDEIFYDEDGSETQRFEMNPATGNMGVQIPKGTWHTVEVFEPSVLFEGKNGAYAPALPEDMMEK